MSSPWRKIGFVACVALPAVALRIVGAELRPEVAVLVFGAGVVTSAFLLAWAAEAAQVDISGSLAIALLALVAVLPEYAVDLYFSFTAGHRPEFAQYAAANMTGSNRLLMGVGWPLVAGVALVALARRRRVGDHALPGPSAGSCRP
jgi:cation:H+ antiporter